MLNLKIFKNNTKKQQQKKLEQRVKLLENRVAKLENVIELFAIDTIINNTTGGEVNE